MPKSDLLRLVDFNSHEYKALKTIVSDGKIYNYQFSKFFPPCLSHTKVMSRIREKVRNKSTEYYVPEATRKAGNLFYWTIERKPT